MVNNTTLSQVFKFRPRVVSKLPRTLHTLGTNVILIPVGIASSILIARTIGPAGKGSFDLIIATSTLLLTALGLSLPAGVTYEVARGDTNVRALSLGLVLIAAAQAIICSFILFAFVGFGRANYFLPSQGQKWWIPAIAVYFFLEMLANHWRAILIGRQEITKSNHVELFARVSQFLLLFLLAGILFLNGRRITVAVLFGLVLSISILLNVALLRALRPAFSSSEGTRNPLKGALAFALPCYFGNLVQFLNYRLDLFILGVLAGYAAVGRYTLAVSLGQLIWLLSSSAASVLLPKIAASEGSTDSIKNTNRLNRLIFAASLISALVLGVVASQAIPLLYGQAFWPSFPALLVILPGIAAFSTVNILAAYIAGIGQPRLNLAVALVALVVTVGLDLYLIPRMNILGASLASTASYSVSALLTIILYMKKTGSSLRQLLVPSSEDFGLAMQLAQPVLKRFRPQRAV
ncbi:MAG TPA: polysaccharide biosynthesis C-terminal domain-containing protein [Pyrinomonadaceae bacterium]